MTPPYVDKHVYTNWNATMISSYLEASAVLGDASTRDFALKSLDRLLDVSYKKDEGMFHFYDGKPHLPNQLADQAATASALTHAYECSGDEKYLDTAEKIIQLAGTKLYDSEHGGFFDTITGPTAPGFLSKPTKPLDENSSAALVLLRLYHLTGELSYYKQVEETLKRFVEVYPSFGFMSAEYGLAVDAFLNEPTMIQIVGSTDRAETKGLLTEANKIYEPRKIIRVLNPDKDSALISARGYRVTDQPTAYICVGKACTAPITEPRQIAHELQSVSLHK